MAMSRVLAIDYGKRRVGLAVSDPLGIFAQPLQTISAEECLDFVTRYCAENQVTKIILGMPTQDNGEPSESQRYIRPFMGRLKKALPEVEIIEIEERGSSVEALEAMIAGGVPKNKRRQKAGLVDRTAAAIILQRYLGDF